MTDHFKDCKPGDTVTVTIKGEITASVVTREIWVGKGVFIRDDPAIISVTVEPRPLEVGDRVRFSKLGPVGTVRAVEDDVAWVKWNNPTAFPEWAISDLERVND